MKLQVLFLLIFLFTTAITRSQNSGVKPDPNFKNHLKGSSVGARKWVVTGSISDYFSGFLSVNARYSATHRFIFEAGAGTGGGKHLAEYSRPRAFTPPNIVYGYDELEPTALKSKSQFFGAIHYVLSSIGAHTFVSFGIYKRQRNLGYIFSYDPGYNTNLKLTQTGGFMASQTKLGRRLVMGWLIGLGQEISQFKNYPYFGNWSFPPTTSVSSSDKNLNVLWQLNLGYIL